MTRLERTAAFLLIALLGVSVTASAGSKRSKPKPAEPAVVQHGKASFYANRFHGQKTANGERMDQNALTAASKVLPLGSTATVTNLETGQSVDVKINDRGPFVPGRVIDLSKSAAAAIDLERKDGIAPVKVEAKPEAQPTQELEDKVKEVATAQAEAKKQAALKRAAKRKAAAGPAKAKAKPRRGEALPTP
jgi:rare lipoprotein A